MRTQTAQVDLIELSKQGNPKAIAVLLNRYLQPKGITAKVSLQENCLRILLESARSLDKQALIPFIFKGITKLELSSINILQIYGRKVDQTGSSWSQTIVINKNNTPSNVSSTAQDESTVLQDQISTAQPTTNPENELTQQILTVVEQILIDKSIPVEVNVKSQVLKIVFKTNSFLDGTTLSKKISQSLNQLDLGSITTARIYKQNPKTSYSFLIQEIDIEALKNSSKTISNKTTFEPVVQSTANSTSRVSVDSKSSVQKSSVQKKNNQIWKKLKVVFIAIVAGFIILRLVMRMRLLIALSSPLGGFTLFISLFFLWRAYSALDPLLQKLLRDD